MSYILHCNFSCKHRSKRCASLVLLPSGPFSPSGTTLSRANTRAAGAPHALLHAHRVKTARTSPRARKHTRSAQKPVSWAQAQCWRPMAVPRRPHRLRASRALPEPGARQLTPRRTRRSAPLTEVYAHCTGACTFFRHHAAPERVAPGRTLHREARAAARRARRPPSTLSVTRAGLLCSLHAACTAALPGLNHSARVLRTAPQPPRACTTQILHCTRRARGTLRARSAIRSVRCPVCLHTAQHMQGTCARRAVPARRCSPHPATVACLTSSPRMPHAVLCALSVRQRPVLVKS